MSEQHQITPHGFDEDAETWRLLRTRPPEPALAWAGEAAGGRVTAVRALRGGLSSATHRLTVTLPGGAAEPVVLRRYVRPDLNEEEPDIALWESRALRFTATIDLPTPRLIATDLTGERAGVPAVLMSCLPGRLEWSPPDWEPWLRRLAGLLPAVHAATPPPGTIRPFAPYDQEGYEPPGWARRPAVWERAVEIFHGPAPDLPATFVHRDFHPGNVLWHGGEVSGVVDWQAASIGPACLDAGHCRGDLLGYGLDVADRFTALWEEISGESFHPWADVITIIGFLDGLREEPPPAAERSALEDALTRSVAALTG